MTDHPIRAGSARCLDACEASAANGGRVAPPSPPPPFLGPGRGAPATGSRPPRRLSLSLALPLALVAGSTRARRPGPFRRLICSRPDHHPEPQGPTEDADV